MYNIIKSISDTNKWPFMYARADFSNLFDEIEKKNTPHIFLDPISETREYGEYNEIISSTYEGSFMMVVSSDIDEESYDYRYQTYIKPLLSSSMAILTDAISCDGSLQIQNWRMTEVINVMDWNADGLVVTFQVREEK